MTLFFEIQNYMSSLFAIYIKKLLLISSLFILTFSQDVEPSSSLNIPIISDNESTDRAVLATNTFQPIINLLKEDQIDYHEYIFSFELHFKMRNLLNLALKKYDLILKNDSWIDALIEYEDITKSKKTFVKCSKCSRQFKKLEFLYLHIVRRHLSDITENSTTPIIFWSDICQFADCSISNDKISVYAVDDPDVRYTRCINFMLKHIETADFDGDDYIKLANLCKNIIFNEIDGQDKEGEFYVWMRRIGYVLFAIFAFVYIIYSISCYIEEKEQLKKT